MSLVEEMGDGLRSGWLGRKVEVFNWGDDVDLEGICDWCGTPVLFFFQWGEVSSVRTCDKWDNGMVGMERGKGCEKGGGDGGGGHGVIERQARDTREGYQADEFISSSPDDSHSTLKQQQRKVSLDQKLIQGFDTPRYACKAGGVKPLVTVEV